MKVQPNAFSRVLCALILSTSLMFTSCGDFLGDIVDAEQSGSDGGQDGSEEKIGPVTVTIEGVTATTATFVGNIDVPSSELFYCEITIYYTDKELFSIDDANSFTIKSFDIDCNFSLCINKLGYNKKYNYWFYVKTKSDGYYSKVKSFTTNNIDVSLFVNSITATSAQISGIVEGLSESDKSQIEVGMVWSSEEGEVEIGKGTELTASEITCDNAVSFVISELIFGTIYYYCSYIKQGDEYVFGEVKTYDMTSYCVNLSMPCAANCYTVFERGLYKFATVKGNSTTSVGDVISVSTLWETFGTSITPNIGDLIKPVMCEDGYITFQTADTFREGNAVIAAKDEFGKILWSWHIWLTDEPQVQMYYNDAGTMMDRNLGAISAIPGDVGALGLLYQWGRKDPFLGSSSVNQGVEAKSTITWPSPVQSDSTTGTIDYAVANPTIFITYNDDTYDWHYIGSQSSDNTRWTESGNLKSIYDPCPPGWRVPDGGSNGVWSQALGSSEYFYGCSFDNVNGGIDFSGKFGSFSSIWYPATGYRGSNGSSHLYGVGNFGNYWSASANGYDAYGLGFDYDSSVRPSSCGSRVGGLAVRCIQE